MEEILKAIDELELKFDEQPYKRLKVQLLKSLVVASEDVSKLIKSQRFDEVEQRIRQLHDDQMEIRARFVVNRFPSGGFY